MTSPLFSRTITVFALLLAVPVLVVLGSLVTPQPQLWTHLLDTVLADYVINSLVLALGVGLLSAGIGTFTAWTVARYQFAGRTLVQWLLLLPMAIPALTVVFVLAFIGAIIEYPVASILLTQQDQLTLAVGAKLFVHEHNFRWGDFAAAAILSGLPITAVFLVAQRWLVSGLAAGGVKG